VNHLAPAAHHISRQVARVIRGSERAACGKRRPGRRLGGGWLAASLAVTVAVPASLGPVHAAIPHASGSWGRAVKVPGSTGLNFGVVKANDPADPSISTIDCPSSGNCSAGGDYADREGNEQVLVVDEVAGKWQRAREVPGSAHLNAGGGAAINSVSCSTAGNCSAGGDYTTRSGAVDAMIVDEVGGSWHPAIEVPATDALNRNGNASVVSVSCTSPGYCSAGGFYTDHARAFQAFVVDEVAGTWGRAQELPGSGVLNVGGNAQVRSISCASPGDCSAGGYYATGKSQFGAFVVNETNGSWGKATAVLNSARLDSGHLAGLDAVSCDAVGFCSAVGNYSTVVGHQPVDESFVVDESNFVWGRAVPLFVPYRLIAAGEVDSTALSCSSPGKCTVGGAFWDASGNWQVFGASQDNGVWGPAAEIAGTGKLNAGANAQITSLSCGAGGYCAAAGYVTTARRALQAFVVLQTNYVWHAAQILPGSEKLNTGDSAEVDAVSCTPAGFCGAGGAYTLKTGSQQLFVANFRP
jgi:hypothetical protein